MSGGICIDFGVLSTCHLLVLEKYGGLVSDEGSCDVELEVFFGLLPVHPVFPHENLDYLLIGVDGHWVVELSAYPHEG